MVYQRVKRTNILTNLNEQNPRLLTVFLQKKRTYFWHISKSKHGHIQYSCSLSPMSASISMGYICNWFEMQNLKSKSKKISNRKCARALPPEKKGHIFGTLAKENMDTRYLLWFFDCLAHPNLSATFATDQKWSLCHLLISYQSLAGGLRSLQKSEFLKLIILIFHVRKLNN